MEKIASTLARWFVLLAFLAVFARARVHLEMQEEELRRVFAVSKPEAVAEYEVVSLQWPTLQRRSVNATTRIRLNAFGKELDLWLHPTEGTLASYDTPVYLAKTTRDRVYLHRVIDAMSVVGKILEDRRKRTTLIVKRSVNGHNLISGYVGSEGWILRPLPDRFNGQAYSSKPNDSSSNLTDDEYDAPPHPHVIFYSNPELSRGDRRRATVRPTEIASRRNTSRTRRAVAPNIVYPQILVITDYATLQRHGKIAELLEYLLPFWNAVDLRYRDLELPKVRLNIAGIIIAGDETALSYLTRNKLSTNMLNVVGTLADFGKFVPSVVRPTVPFSFDVAFTMSTLNMCQPKDSYCIPGTLGYAYDEGACAIDERDESPMDFGVAVIQDEGAFDGVQTAAHELGHLLGARHDGAGETPCSSATGNVMAATPILTAQSQDWSNCSLIAFDNFFKSDASACLLDEPKASVALDRALPASFMSLDQQCERLVGTQSCRTENDPCVQLGCLTSGPGKTCKGTQVAAADGSVCGNHKFCLHERCVDVGDLVY